MFKVQKEGTYKQVPRYILEDDKLSLSAKGLYVLMFTCASISNDESELRKLTSSGTQEYDNAFEELLNTGYIVKDKDHYVVCIVAKKNKATVTSADNIELPFDTVDETMYSKPEPAKPAVKRPNKYQQIISLIDEYTSDYELNQALKQYFVARLNPEPDSRFASSSPLQIYQVKAMLNQLNTLKGSKLEIVQLCLEKQYFKFFEIQKPKAMDGVESNTYTLEDIENIKRRAAKLEADGEQSVF